MTTSRRQRRTTQGGRTGASPLASRRFGRRLFGVMATVAVIYAAFGLYRVAHAARTFGPVYLGMSRAEIRYIHGTPVARSPDGDLWRMRDGGVETSVLFDDADRVAAVGCRAAAGGDGAACPDVLDVRVGDGEGAVWLKFGAPTAEHYRGDRKIMAYPELGVRFELQRTTVVAVEHRRWQGPVALALRAVSLLAP